MRWMVWHMIVIVAAYCLPLLSLVSSLVFLINEFGPIRLHGETPSYHRTCAPRPMTRPLRMPDGWLYVAGAVALAIE